MRETNAHHCQPWRRMTAAWTPPSRRPFLLCLPLKYFLGCAPPLLDSIPSNLHLHCECVSQSWAFKHLCSYLLPLVKLSDIIIITIVPYYLTACPITTGLPTPRKTRRGSTHHHLPSTREYRAPWPRLAHIIGTAQSRSVHFACVCETHNLTRRLRWPSVVPKALVLEFIIICRGLPTFGQLTVLS